MNHRITSFQVAIVLIAVPLTPIAAADHGLVGDLPGCPASDPVLDFTCSVGSYVDHEVATEADNGLEEADQVDDKVIDTRNALLGVAFDVAGYGITLGFDTGSNAQDAAWDLLGGQWDGAWDSGSRIVGDTWDATDNGYTSMWDALGASNDFAWGLIGAMQAAFWGFGATASQDAMGIVGGLYGGGWNEAGDQWLYLFGTAGQANRLFEPDQDGNGLGDVWEQVICDIYEMGRGCNLFAPLPHLRLACSVSTDFDCDGLDLFEEWCWGTDPFNPDTDNDNWSDGAEAAYWKGITDQSDSCDQTGPTASRYKSAMRDDDNDGRPNILDRDSDNDYMQDGDEASGVHNIHYNQEPTKPHMRDSDGEGLSDYMELCNRSNQPHPNLECMREGWGSNPHASDSDADGASDLAEALAWGDERFQVDYDGDGSRNNLVDPDSDGDSWPGTNNANDGAEIHGNPPSDPGNWDTDGDGLPDGFELHFRLRPTFRDGGLDADNDGLSNHFEYSYGRPIGWNEAMQGPYAGGLDPTSWDVDGDSISDGQEYHGTLNPWKGRAFIAGNPGSTDPRTSDTDGDGWSDGHEALVLGTDPNDFWGDLDGDGLTDRFEADGWLITVDGTTRHVTSDLARADTDLDGMSDYEDWDYGTDPRSVDTDGDGLDDLREILEGLNPRSKDTDGDGLEDGFEARFGCSPLMIDTDGDGINDWEEAMERGTSCNSVDSDRDGLADRTEIDGWTIIVNSLPRHVTSDPLRTDSDLDGLTDAEEYLLGTDPQDTDTDNDGIPDGQEATLGMDPTFTDSDGDGLSNDLEMEHGTDPNNPDTDGDGLNDYEELMVFRTDPLQEDSDFDGFPDILDPRPLLEDLPPLVTRIQSVDYSRGFTLWAADVSSVTLPSDEGTWDWKTLSYSSGTPCSAYWDGERASKVYVERSREDDQYRFDVTFRSPLQYCEGYTFNLIDGNENNVKVDIRLDGSLQCVKESNFKLWTTSVAGPSATGATARKYAGPAAGAGAAFGYDVGYSMGTGDSFSEMRGKIPIMLFDSLSAALPRVAGMALFAVSSAVVLGTGELVSCQDNREWTDQVVPNEDIHLVTFTDQNGAKVTLHKPGHYESRADPAAGSSQTFHRGAGLTRAQQEAPGLTESDVERVLTSAAPAGTGRVKTYCGAGVGNAAHYLLTVRDNYVLTAQRVTTC